MCVSLVVLTATVHCARYKSSCARWKSSASSKRYYWSINSYTSQSRCQSCCRGAHETCESYSGKGCTLWKCIPDCGPLVAPSHSMIEMTGTTFESLAIYTCEDGYHLVGDCTRTCLSSGKWSGHAPVCERAVPECPVGFNYYFKQRSSCYYIPTGNNEENGKSWDDARKSNAIRVTNSLDPDQGLVWVQTHCNDLQQTTRFAAGTGALYYTKGKDGLSAAAQIVLAGSSTDYWIGAREVADGDYEWQSSNYPVDLLFWAPNQPTDAVNLTCIMLCDHAVCGSPEKMFYWNDFDCPAVRQFICETTAL